MILTPQSGNRAVGQRRGKGGETMQKRVIGEPSGSRREQAHRAMLEAALARPGVHEAMEVYGIWQDRDRGLDGYRAAAANDWHTTATDSSSAG